MTSEATRHATEFVAARLPQAAALGRALGEWIDDPEQFVSALRAGFMELSDPPYLAAQARIAPGGGPVIGVRWPLVDAVAAELRSSLQASSAASALWLAQRLAREEQRELRLFSHVPLQRSLAEDPERSWQLIRRLGRAANDWISVDSLAELLAQGIIREPFRWAELEQLIYSDHRFERRLVGSTIARIPFTVPQRERRGLDGRTGLEILRSLIGDADDQVQKALGWALREWTRVDPDGVRQLLIDETRRARETADGHRAWVIRDALAPQPAEFATDLRRQLEGIRRRRGAPSTSRAAVIAAQFAGMGELATQTIHHQGDRMAGGFR